MYVGFCGTNAFAAWRSDDHRDEWASFIDICIEVYEFIYKSNFIVEYGND